MKITAKELKPGMIVFDMPDVGSEGPYAWQTAAVVILRGGLHYLVFLYESTDIGKEQAVFAQPIRDTNVFYTTQEEADMEALNREAEYYKEELEKVMREIGRRQANRGVS